MGNVVLFRMRLRVPTFPDRTRHASGRLPDVVVFPVVAWRRLAEDGVSHGQGHPECFGGRYPPGRYPSAFATTLGNPRSEERRVGKMCRLMCSTDHLPLRICTQNDFSTI